MAQMPFSPCDTTAGPCVDASVDMLRRIFGGVVDALTQGLDPNTVAASSNVLASMFSYFNSGILIIGSLIVSYVAVMGTLNTANDGEAMGRNWSSLWTPVRIVTGGAVLLPTASGFSFIQLVVMLMALWGVGFANGTYKVGTALGIMSPNGIVAGVNKPGTFYGLRDFAKQYLAASYCARVANTIYADTDNSPQVKANNNVDKSVTTSGRTENFFYVQDRNTVTNLAGGSPFCGTIKVGTYNAQGSSDKSGIETALEQIRVNVQNIKVSNVNGLMSDLDNWVATWPATLNETGWDGVDSNQFNMIVNAWESKVTTAVTSSITNDTSGVDSSLNTFANSLTSDGWAMAGGWYQRIGYIRGKIGSVISEPVGTVTEPSFSGLPNDSRAVLLQNSVTTVVETVLKKAETKPDYASSSTVKPEDMASMIPKNGASDINVGSIKSDMDAKMSSFVNNTMKNSVDIALGTGASGVDSISRMKLVGDYLAFSRIAAGVAQVTIETAVTALRVVAGGVGSVKVFGNGIELDKVTTPIWDWVMAVPIEQLAKLISYLEPMAFYFGVFLPSLPYTIFMIAVAGWVLAVLQSVIAAPLWAVMHMTPERTFVGSQTQGYLLLLSLFARPALAVVGLFGAIVVADPIIDYIAKGFFSMRGAVVSSTGTVGAIAEFLTFAWWFIVFGLTLLPVLYMTFGLPQILPDHVLRWIGVGVADLGETNAIGQMRNSMSVAGARVSSDSNKSSRIVSGSRNSGNTSLSSRNEGNYRNQPINVNPQGVAPLTNESASLNRTGSFSPKDSRGFGKRFSDGAGVALGRAITDTASVTSDAGVRLATIAMNAGREGVSAYHESAQQEVSHFKKIQSGLRRAAKSNFYKGSKILGDAGGSYKAAIVNAGHEGVLGYREGADSRINAYKEQLRNAKMGKGSSSNNFQAKNKSSSEVLSHGQGNDTNLMGNEFPKGISEES